MSRDYFCIGPTPLEEDCAHVGTLDYHEKTMKECRRFIALLRRIFGPEPEGAMLQIKAFEHDFGTYLTVVCYYDDADPAAAEYARRCEDQCPPEWDDEARRELSL